LNIDTLINRSEWKKIDENRWNKWKHAYSKESAQIVYDKYNLRIDLANEHRYKVVQLWEVKV
jgi:hypothetical protein